MFDLRLYKPLINKPRELYDHQFIRFPVKCEKISLRDQRHLAVLPFEAIS